ncbi:MAG: SDR family NAD(P)-dependent oxidoreductase [Eubacteriales bacterium]|nr:SDR family NAD(P)-dependent oxidoreductase [Eubacteriales bacterium]
MNVMITGAAGGFGRALANECGRRGYDLFLTDMNAEGLESIQYGIERQFNAAVSIYPCDLTNVKQVDDMLAGIDRQGIRFDMLLNVAGIDYEGGFMRRERETIAKIVSMNDTATLRISHAVLERRKKDARFTVLFVSSLASMFPMPLKATYAASKRFLFDFALALRQELKDQNASVTVLCPGGLATTNEAMEGIAAQGFWGTATTNKLEKVARKIVEDTQRGKAVYIPGLINRSFAFLGAVVPRSAVAAIVYNRFKGAQKAWLETGEANKLLP